MDSVRRSATDQSDRTESSEDLIDIRADGDTVLDMRVDNSRNPIGEERLVKSTERVRDLGEVFTPFETVKAMLDLIPTEMWEPHPSATFLEPACGDGNFLVEILRRKLGRIADEHRVGELAAGACEIAAQFHALQALASIYAVDISVDNVVGGTPGHEIGARARLLSVFSQWHLQQFGKQLNTRSVLLKSAQWVVERNIQVGNMLPFNADGSPSGRDSLPLVEYTWNPLEFVVAVRSTTLGAVESSSSGTEAEGQGAFSFAEPEPVTIWSGYFAEVRQALVDAPDNSKGDDRNSNKGRRSNAK